MSLHKAGKPAGREFSDGWIAAYKEILGQDYIYQAKDGVAAARLLKQVSPLVALATAKKAWRQTDTKKFWACVNQSKDIPKFVSAFNAIQREVAATSAFKLAKIAQ